MMSQFCVKWQFQNVSLCHITSLWHVIRSGFKCGGTRLIELDLSRTPLSLFAFHYVDLCVRTERFTWVDVLQWSHLMCNSLLSDQKCWWHIVTLISIRGNEISGIKGENVYKQKTNCLWICLPSCTVPLYSSPYIIAGSRRARNLVCTPYLDFGGNLGCFPLCQRFRKFRLEFKWKGPFWFLLTGIFGITSGGDPHISVGIFRPKFTVPFLTYGFFALIRKFGKRIQNDESHFYWLARFNRKMPFHFPQVFQLKVHEGTWPLWNVFNLHTDNMVPVSTGITSYTCAKFKNFPLCKIVEIKIGGKTRFENLLKQLFHSSLLDMKCL